MWFGENDVAAFLATFFVAIGLQQLLYVLEACLRGPRPNLLFELLDLAHFAALMVPPVVLFVNLSQVLSLTALQ